MRLDGASPLVSKLKSNREANEHDLIRQWRLDIVENGLTVALVLLLLLLIGVALQGGPAGQVHAIRQSPALLLIGVAKLWKSGPTQLRACALIGAGWFGIAAAVLERGFSIPNPWVAAIVASVLTALVFNRRHAWIGVALSGAFWALMSVPWLQGRQQLEDSFLDLSVPGNWARMIFVYLLLSSGATASILFIVGRLETALNRSKALNAEVAQIGDELTQLIDTANAPIFGVDAELRVTKWNQTAAAITGYTKTEVLGHCLITEFITEDFQMSVRAVLIDALAGKQTANFEFPLFAKSGARVDVLLNTSTQRDVDGNVIGVVGVGQDITALEKERALLRERVAERTADLIIANTDLAAAARSKDEFLASMSHELRTPLSAVLNISESLQEGVYGSINESQDAAVRTVEASGRHLLSLINEVLDLAKVSAGTMSLSMESVSVADICDSSIQLLRDLALKKRLKLTVDFDEQVTVIRSDGRRLKQILVNLLSNAVKFTPESGAIGLEVTGRPELNTVHFSVWDTGVGISTEEQSRLFKPFVQLDAGLNRKYEGTGLGLSLVARMTELLGGSVRLESPGHGHGSRFTISLPWSDAMIAASPNTPPPSLPVELTPAPSIKYSAGPRPLILLAEDNEGSIASMSDFLKAKGYRLVVARNGAEAVDLNSQMHPALILMDIQMPKLDGLEATREIRKDPAFSQVPIIALTALALSGDRARCLAAGVNEYMTKPVSLRQLNEAIKTMLSEKAN